MENSATPAPIAVTLGEPAGIGCEITLRAWEKRSEDSRPFFIIAPAQHLRDLSAKFNINCPIVEISEPHQAVSAIASGLPVIPLAEDVKIPITLGLPSAESAPAVIGAIDQAIEFVKAGTASAIVTNPIQKSVLKAGGFSFPGHTEYLAHSANIASVVMMLAVEGLRVVPVTVHMALEQVARELTSDAIVRCGQVTARALRQDFGISSPRIAVAALNPHAGEDGHFGDEEARIISPAIDQLNENGFDVFGPEPADTLFHEAARKKYDAVLCMYHDQALIPLKTIDFANGVNVTLGLPFVRASPDHGTACDIATEGIADPTSFLAALRMASKIATSREKQTNA